VAIMADVFTKAKRPEVMSRTVCLRLGARLAELFRECAPQPLQGIDLLGLTFPDDDNAPAKFAKRTLMEKVAGGVAFEFRQPPHKP